MRPKARDRFREPRVEPVANRKVRTKSGKSQSYQVALTAEEYVEREAKLKSANVAALDAARTELEEATAHAPLALPISEPPPRRLQSIDADVRLYAAQTELRARPRPEPLHLFARDGILKFSDAWEVCEHCGQAPCELSWDTDEEPDHPEPAWDPREVTYSVDDIDGRAQWELDHADAIAEDGAAARQEAPTELSERWPTQPPPDLALPLGQWLHRNHAAQLIGAANGGDDPETGACWLQAMMRAGLVDCREFDVRLLPENERPGSPDACAEEGRLSRLAADLKALGLKAVPEEPV